MPGAHKIPQSEEQQEGAPSPSPIPRTSSANTNLKAAPCLSFPLPGRGDRGRMSPWLVLRARLGRFGQLTVKQTSGNSRSVTTRAEQMYSFPNVKMHLAQGLKRSDGKSCFLSSLRLGSPEHHAPAAVGDASRARDGASRAGDGASRARDGARDGASRARVGAAVLAGSSGHRHATR